MDTANNLAPAQPDGASQARRANPELLEKLFDGTENWDSFLPPEVTTSLDRQMRGVIDPKASRMRMANKTLVADAFGLAPGEVDRLFEPYRNEWAKQVLRIEPPKDDATFYAEAGKWMKKRRDERVLIRDMTLSLFEDFRKGGDFERSFERYRTANKATHAGWDSFNDDVYRHAQRSTWNKWRQKEQELEGPIAAVRSFLEASRKRDAAPASQALAVSPLGAPSVDVDPAAQADAEYARTRAAAIEALRMLGPQDREMVADLAAGGLLGEGEAREPGFTQKVSAAMGRGTEALVQGAFRSIRDFATQGSMAWEADRQRWADESTIEGILDARARGETSTVRSDSWFAQGFLDAAESTPRMLAMLTPTGFAANLLAVRTEMRDEFRARGLSEEAGANLASIAALPYAALDFVQSKMVFKGSVPGINRILPPLSSLGIKEGVRRAVVVGGVEFGEQLLQETAQDLTAPAVQAIAGMFSSSIPDVNVGEELKRVALRTPETIAALLPFVLVGTGTATFRDRAFAKEYLQDPDAMVALGLDPKTVQKVMQAKSPEIAARLIEMGWKDRKPSAAQQAAVERVQARMDAGMSEMGVEVTPRKPLPPGTTFAINRPTLMQERIQVPGQVQIDIPTGAEGTARGTESMTIPQAVAAGWDVPGIPFDIPQGLFTLEQLNEEIAARGGVGASFVPSPIGVLPFTQAAATRRPIVERSEGRWLVRDDAGNVIGEAATPEAAAAIVRESRNMQEPAPDLTTETARHEARSEALNSFATERLEARELASTHLGRAGEELDPEAAAQQIEDAVAAGTMPETALADAQRLRELADRQPVPYTDAQEGSVMNLSAPHHPAVSFKGTPGKRVNGPQVIKAISRILEDMGQRGFQLFRTGRMPRKLKWAGGYFEPRTKLIRIRTANDIVVAAHEAAHALDDLLWGFGSDLSKVFGAAAMPELDRLGQELYGKRKPYGGYASEGWAEFFMMWLTDEARARKEAPNTAAGWERVLAANPTLAKSVDRAQKLAHRFFQQGSSERMKAGIAGRPGVFTRVAEGSLEQLANARKRWLDMGAPIEDFTSQAMETMEGFKAVANEPFGDPFFILSSRRMTAEAVVDYMVNHAMLDWAGNPVGPPLKDAFALAMQEKGRDVDDFTIYLWARRAILLWNSGRNPGVALKDAVQVYQDLHTTRYGKAAAMVYDWNDQLLNYAAQASPDFERTARAVRQGDVGNYIPLFREFSAYDERYAGAPPGGGASLVKRLKGSGRRILDPVEGMLLKAKAIVLKSQQKAVLDAIMRIAKSAPHMGYLVREVPKEQLAARVPQWQVISGLVKKLEAKIGKERAKELGEAIDDVLQGELFTFFIPAFNPKQNEVPVLPVFERGKVKWYEMDAELYSALSSMDMWRMNKALDLILGMPGRTYRLGTTGLRASFSLATNPIRDLRTLMANSSASASQRQLFGYWLLSMKEAFFDAITAGKVRSPAVDLADRLGVEMAQFLGQDTRPLTRAARRLRKGGKWDALDFGSHVDFVRKILQIPETAARLAEMRAVAADLGYDFNQRLTPAIAQRLLLAAKQVTTDFTAAGSWARAVNQAVPFFNAGIQGPRAHIRAFRRDPTRFLGRSLVGTALVVALWFRNKDEEWWKEMSTKERYLYTYIPTGDELIRIPRSFELDGIFMAGTEALLDAWYQEEPELATEWASTFLQNITQMDVVNGYIVPPLPVPVKAMAEQLANRDFFFDRPLVPKGEQEGVRPEEQYNEFTTSVSIQAGEILGMSPRRIEHVIRSMFGPVGIDLASMFGRGDPGDKQVQREMELADIPIWGTLFQRGGQMARSSRSIDALYDRYEEALHVQRSKREQETKEQRRERLMLADAVRAQTALNMIARHEPTREKRQELHTLRIAVARRAIEMAESGNIARIETRIILNEARKELRELEKQAEPAE